jgi:hypothetical protein
MRSSGAGLRNGRAAAPGGSSAIPARQGVRVARRGNALTAWPAAAQEEQVLYPAMDDLVADPTERNALLDRLIRG